MQKLNGEIRFYRSSGNFGFLSNLYPCKVKFEGSVFRNSEEAYQFGKPKDKAIAEWIVNAPKPHLCAIAAHSLLAFDIKPNWSKIKVERMRQVLKAKFSQNLELMKQLLETKGFSLVEDSKTDSFWGVGKKGNGKNMLGQLLMELRDSTSLNS